MVRSIPLFAAKAWKMGPEWWPLIPLAPFHPFVTRWPRKIPVPFGPFRFRLGTTDLVAMVTLLADLDEALMRAVLQRVDAVIDGGANVAAFAVILSEWAPRDGKKREWIAVELCSDNAEVCRSQPLLPGMTVVNKALGASPGVMRWTRGINEATAQVEGADEVGFLAREFDHKAVMEETEVVTLAGLTAKNAFLKLDIEGAEYAVLEAGVPDNIQFMLVEFHVFRRSDPPAPSVLVPEGHWYLLSRDILAGETWFWMRRDDAEIRRLVPGCQESSQRTH